MPLHLSLLVETNISQSNISELDQHLIDVFPFTKVNVIKSVELPRSCWNKSRSQFDANCLLSFAASYRSTGVVVLLTSKDAYVSGLNFVFGVASKGLGAVISVFRLENDPEFILKEITHELGHVFGLGHCSLPCVMTFSNSVWEARLKSSAFCKKCWKQLSEERFS